MSLAVPMIATVVTAATNVVSGHTAFTLMVSPRSDAPKNTGARSIYAIFGSSDKLLSVPPAFHVASPFGTDFGGTNPAFWQINADSQWDSWLTVGITQGDQHNLISSIGIDWTTWTADGGLSVDDGAVFWVSGTVPCGHEPIVANVSSGCLVYRWIQTMPRRLRTNLEASPWDR